MVNFLTYFQLCLIANAMIAVGPMLLLLLAEIVVAVVLIYVYTELYYKLYAPHDMLLVYGNKRGIGLKIKMDSRRDKYNVSKLMSIDEGWRQCARRPAGMTRSSSRTFPPRSATIS